MQTVSESFKNAIKSDTRRIYGYVDITYQDKDYERSAITYPTPLEIFLPNGSGLVRNNKTLKKYATLENNYTLLDGSFVVWNENRFDYDGYISNDIFSNIQNKTIIIQNNNTNDLYAKGVTIYFKENLPFNFTVTFTDTDNNTIVDTVTNNSSYTYQYIFENEIELYRVQLDITNVEFPNNRIRIASVSFTIGDIYEGEELVSFDVTEQIDLLMESLPMNTCTVNLNNYPDVNGRNKFDPINPLGITKLLTQETTIKPYIGVLTEENGVEYVPMGVFYLNDWSSNTDGNVTFNGTDVLGKIKSMDIPTVGGFLNKVNWTIYEMQQYIYNQTGITLDLVQSTFDWKLLNNYNFFEWLRLLLSYTLSSRQNGEYFNTKFNVTRDGIARQSYYNDSIVDSIDRNQLLEDVDYKTKNRIKYVNIKYNPDTNTTSVVSGDPGFTATHTLSSYEDYVWFVMDKTFSSASLSYVVNSGSGVAELIDYNNRMIYVKFTGEIGSVITITYNGTVIKGYETTLDQTFQNDLEQGDKITLDYRNYKLMNTSKNVNPLVRFYLTQDKKYKVKARTIGDPSLECGDVVSVQTRYQDVNDGYKNFIITKQQFSYNGGLQCDIEGLGD